MGVLGLSHLYRKEADYFAYSDGDNQFYFNLCGPTVDPRCNGAGACLASRKKIQQNWVPLGSSSTVSISYNEKKEIIYSMKGTQPCTESSTPGTTLSLDIHLVCANEETRPQFHYVEDRCHFHLSMRTPRVCDQPVDHQNCEWDQYSLAPLRRSIDTKVEGKSTSYFLNVCGPLTSTSCGENATVCATYSSSSTIAIGNHAGKLALGKRGMEVVPFLSDSSIYLSMSKKKKGKERHV
ncbi:hypothetical protein HMI55_000537 [Coelomomyces lativittatus]|nr:hypothetical protein HMI55_000537 [Coelomomyces lativittatus]